MKAFLSALVGGVLASGSALAADLSVPLARAPVAAATYDWSGVYVGGHVGGGWEKTTFSDPSATANMQNCCTGFTFAGGGQATDATAKSFLGGAQIGWMYQIGRLVIGGDFDWSWTRLNGDGGASLLPTFGTPPGAIPNFASESYSVSTKWTATATTTIGVASDRWMFYSKVGAAMSRHEYGLAINGQDTLVVLGGPPLFAVSTSAAPFGFSPANVSDRLVGWTVGTGVKWAITNSWFLNLEYDYMDFGSKGQNFSAVCAAAPVPAGAFVAGCGPVPGAPPRNPTTFSPTFNSHISEVKVGLNYKFPSGFLFW